MATIQFKRDKEGNLIAFDSETGKAIGNVTTMGDDIKQDTTKKDKKTKD